MDIIDWRFTSSDIRFPGPHRFGSLNWQAGRYGFPDTVLGEIPGEPRIYRKGADPTPLPGTHHCGLDDWYRVGVPLPLAQVPLDLNGELACCSGLQAQPADGEPPVPPAPPGHITESWTGLSGPAVFGPSRHWTYHLSNGNNYTWLNFLTRVVGRRTCATRKLRATPFGGFIVRDLVFRTYDPATRHSTLTDPTGVAIPTGAWVEVFPG